LLYILSPWQPEHLAAQLLALFSCRCSIFAHYTVLKENVQDAAWTGLAIQSAMLTRAPHSPSLPSAPQRARSSVRVAAKGFSTVESQNPYAEELRKNAAYIAQRGRGILVRACPVANGQLFCDDALLWGMTQARGRGWLARV
jgi:hypothetical protein